MRSRQFVALLLSACLAGAVPDPAPEALGGGDDAAELSRAAAVASSSMASPPQAVRTAALAGLQVALPTPVAPLPPPGRVRAARVRPRVQAAEPDMVTCPSQGPPLAG